MEEKHLPRLEKSQIRGLLGRLCTHGVRRYWITDGTPQLLTLACVRGRIPHERTRDNLVEPLIEVLNEAVSRVGNSQHQKVLQIVLGLDADYLQTPIRDRRAAAGRDFRGGYEPVNGQTIRKYHEPQALDTLAEIIDQMESDARQASSPA